MTVLGLAACNSEPRAAEPTPTLNAEPTTPDPTPEPTPTPAATDEADPFGEPPPPPSLDALIGEDFEALARAHEAFRSWLYRFNPDPDELERIYHPDCPCQEAETRLLAHYRENGLRWTGGTLVIERVEVVDDQVARLVVLRVTTVRDEPSYLVDADGEVHDELEARTRTEELVFVRDGEDAPWVLRTFSEA